MQLKHYSLDLAIQETAKNYTGGAQALGLKIGANSRTFTNKCNPKENHLLTIEEFISVMQVTADYRMLDALAELFGYVCIAVKPLEKLSDTNVLMSWANWHVQVGELAKTLAVALEDGKITTDEYAAVRISMFEEFTRELQLLKLLEQHLVSIDCPLLSELQEKNVSASINLAIKSTVETGSTDSDLAIALDLRQGNIKRKLNPDDEGMSFNIREIVKLMQLTNDHHIL